MQHDDVLPRERPAESRIRDDDDDVDRDVDSGRCRALDVGIFGRGRRHGSPGTPRGGHRRDTLGIPGRAIPVQFLIRLGELAAVVLRTPYRRSLNGVQVQ